MRSVVRIYPGPPIWYDAGWSSPVARWAHNPKVAGSNPAPATNFAYQGGVAQLAEHRVCNAGVRGSNPLTSTKRIADLRLPIVTAIGLEVSEYQR